MRKFTFLVLVLLLVMAPLGVQTSSARQNKVQITLWHQEQPPHRVERFQSIADDFNASHPDIEVKIEVQDWNAAYQRLTAAAAAGRQPDMMFVIPDFAQTVLKLDLAQPVTALVKELDEQHDFVDAAIEPYYYNDEYWAVPLYGMEQMLWYRKDIFEEAGIESAPKTWEELVQVAEQLTADGRYGIAVPAGRNLASDQVIYSFLITSGAKDMFDENCNVTFNTPETVRALELYQQLLTFSPPDATSYSWGEPQALFNSGQVAMAIEKGQYLKPFEEESGQPAEALGMAHIPVPSENGVEGTIYYSNAVMVFSKDEAKQQAAHEFIRYLLTPEVYGTFLTAEPGLFLPVTMSGLESETLWEDPIIQKYRPYVEEMIDYSSTGALFGFTSGRICPEITAISQQNLLAQTVQRVAVGDATAGEAAAWAQEQMEEAVRQFRETQ